jgi:hypothetical protein
VAEVEYRALSWPHPRRLILLRHRVAERPQAGGKQLLDVPGYVFQALVTSLPVSVPPLAVWRDDNGRADCENVIKLAVPPRERDWWSRLWEKILSLISSCNAVENRPIFAG